jgi:hypothetical protein
MDYNIEARLSRCQNMFFVRGYGNRQDTKCAALFLEGYK